MTISTHKLGPLDWAMGYIRQLDDPENGENYHPYYARLASLALPVFELYTAMNKIVTTPYPLILQYIEIITRDSMEVWSVLLVSYEDIWENKLNAMGGSWAGLVIVAFLVTPLALFIISIPFMLCGGLAISFGAVSTAALPILVLPPPYLLSSSNFRC